MKLTDLEEALKEAHEALAAVSSALTVVEEERDALVVERDEARAQRDAYRDERDNLTTIVSSGIDDVAGAELDDLEARALAAETQRDKLRAELLAALKAIRNAARKNRVDPDAIYEIANGAIRDAARSTLNEIAP